MKNRKTSADFVTAFATGWPENQPDIMVLSLTTKGRAGFRVQQGAGPVDRQDDQGDRGKARQARRVRARRFKISAVIPRACGDPEPRPVDQSRRRWILDRPVKPGDDSGVCGYFDSAILAPRNWLSARIVTDCLLPVVRSEILALNPAALATTWKLPPPPRPCRVPPTLRLALAPGAGDRAALVDDIGCEVEFVGVAGAGEGHFHVGTRRPA